MMDLPRVTVFELLGGEAIFFQLAQAFYQRIDNDTLLRPMFPHDLSGAKERLALFLIQYFGGPSTYSEQRGHPRLRMRHIPFKIGQAERDAWVAHMFEAIDSLSITEPARTQMREYFEYSATFMINQPAESPAQP